MIGSAERSALLEAESLLSMVEFVVENFADAQRALTTQGDGTRTVGAGPIKGAPWRGLQLTVAQVRERLLQVLEESPSIVEPVSQPIARELPAPLPEVTFHSQAQTGSAIQSVAPLGSRPVEPPPIESRPVEPRPAATSLPVSARPQTSAGGTADAIQAPAPAPQPPASHGTRSEVPPALRAGLSGTLASRIQMAPLPTDVTARPRTGRTRELNPLREESRQSNTE